MDLVLVFMEGGQPKAVVVDGPKLNLAFYDRDKEKVGKENPLTLFKEQLATEETPENVQKLMESIKSNWYTL